jgi:hypothetical protein
VRHPEFALLAKRSRVTECSLAKQVSCCESCLSDSRRHYLSPLSLERGRLWGVGGGGPLCALSALAASCCLTFSRLHFSSSSCAISNGESGYLSRYGNGFDSRQDKIFLFSTASRPALGPTQPPIQWAQRVISPGVKRQRREADHSPLTSAEVKNTWNYTSTPPYTFMA